MLYELLLACLLVGAALSLYVLSTFLLLLLRQALSPLRHLRGPPSPSFFLGNLREMHDQENTNLVVRWEEQYGSTFVYRGFMGGARLMTTDPIAVAHILGRGYDYPKPDFVRDNLANMAAGEHGILTVEGEDHRRQVRRPPPSSVRPFTNPHTLICTAVQRKILVSVALVLSALLFCRDRDPRPVSASDRSGIRGHVPVLPRLHWHAKPGYTLEWRSR